MQKLGWVVAKNRIGGGAFPDANEERSPHDLLIA